MKFLIDPGHGGQDPGAVGFGGAKEKDINLAVSMMIAGFMGMNQSNPTHLTRYTDLAIELDHRCHIANEWPCDCFISIHCNAADSPHASGFEVWTSPGWTPADPIATRLWQALKEDFPDMRTRLDTSDGDPDKEADFYVLKGTAMPAVLVELGFISNPDEERRLLSPVFQAAVASAIASALQGVANG